MSRTGTQYLQAIADDGRSVYLGGERIGDVTRHPAFRGVAASAAALYDLAADPTNDMTYPSPRTGEPVNKVFLIPRSRDDLVARRLASQRWAEATYGLLGRSPDHVAAFLAGFASAPDVFSKNGPQFAANVQRFYEDARDHDWYVAYTIVPPQIDRSRPVSQQEESHLAAGVYQERDDGIVVRGAQMLGTAAAVADWLFLSCIHPLKPGDEDYAISLAVPMNAPGLKLYCRRSYAVGQPSVFDYPLSTRFDETDALVVFDDVFVPWERVFLYRDVEAVRAQFFATPAHILGNTQAQVRFLTKMRFLAGLARKITATTGVDKAPPVQGALGELASWVATVEAMLLAAEYACVTDPRGVVYPNPEFLYGVMAQQPGLYNQALQTVRELAGGGLIQLPASVDDFYNPETRADIERYVRSPQVPAAQRVKLFKLAWDLIGSEFAGRHQQYEMFYGGAPFLVKNWAFQNFPYPEAVHLVDRCLDSYDMTTR